MWRAETFNLLINRLPRTDLNLSITIPIRDINKTLDFLHKSYKVFDMERKLASIQIIHDLQPIPGADAILVATVLGWQCVVRKGEFNIGDRCIYFEIDSILPVSLWNEHLRKGSDKDKPLRIRSIRLRSTLSQGLALPLSLFEKDGYKVIEEESVFYLAK